MLYYAISFNKDLINWKLSDYKILIKKPIDLGKNFEDYAKRININFFV